MLHNPDVMKRCQRQIDDVIGRHRAPSMKDKASMPYVEATILEILRMSDVVPFGVSVNLLRVFCWSFFGGFSEFSERIEENSEGEIKRIIIVCCKIEKKT